ncbi:exosome complex component RRP40-like [Sycon ciliatum]|uniref:exosome complex component RRP40-like n=1 Tax=Sycon ciliatum TaxID=27933 RepID=UPI0020AA967F|eukprot:scpid93891/ scgid31628/ Exosome complex component RRP40; Exosome component 3; Ribosomal RNA-processing protein 40; p10
MDSQKVNRVILPGDVLGEVTEKVKLRFGPGIRRGGDEIIATKSGILRHRRPVTYWIDNNQRRYVPVVDEFVIGVVTGKPSMDVYRVDIGGSMPASLSYLNFEGATKRNRPAVQVGDTIYGQLIVASKDMEPEMTCVSVAGKANGMGVLEGGLMFQCSLGLSRKLLVTNSPILAAFGKRFRFEITVGTNGRVWVKSPSIGQTIALCNSLDAASQMTMEQIEAMLSKLEKAAHN